MEVKPRTAKQYKCHHCCSCKNYRGKGDGEWGKKKVPLSHFLADCRYIREAKVRRIKTQLYSPDTPNSVREQIFAPKERALGNRLTAKTLMCLQMQMEIVADVLADKDGNCR